MRIEGPFIWVQRVNAAEPGSMAGISQKGASVVYVSKMQKLEFIYVIWCSNEGQRKAAIGVLLGHLLYFVLVSYPACFSQPRSYWLPSMLCLRSRNLALLRLTSLLKARARAFYLQEICTTRIVLPLPQLVRRRLRSNHNNGKLCYVINYVFLGIIWIALEAFIEPHKRAYL